MGGEPGEEAPAAACRRAPGPPGALAGHGLHYPRLPGV